MISYLKYKYMKYFFIGWLFHGSINDNTLQDISFTISASLKCTAYNQGKLPNAQPRFKVCKFLWII